MTGEDRYGSVQWRRLVPGLAPARGVAVVRISAVVFYLYTLAVVVGIGRLVDLMQSTASGNRIEAMIALAGWLLVYLAAVGPAVAGGGRSGKVILAVMRRFQKNRMAVAGAFCFLLLFALSLLAPLIAPYDPGAQPDPAGERYLAPSSAHPMGTDKFGRDIFSRVLYGSRVSLAVGVLAMALASVIGLIVGAFSGYFGGRLDDVAMRVVDGFLAFPRLLFLLTLIAFFSNSLWLVVLLLAVTGWMGVARLVRAEVLSLKQREFVQAAVATGVGRAGIVWKHLVPNTLGPVIVGATLRIGAIILLESYLSFLGLGVQPPTPSWGSMVFEGRDVLLSAWWVSAFPGMAIVAAVMACNMVGDGLRDAMDVKTT